jgi:hypothetical protein
VRAGPAVLLVGGSAYSLIAASTTPFTLPADVLTGLVIVGMALLVIVRWPWRTRSAAPAPAPAPAPRAAAHSYLPWLLLLVVFTAWELFNYLVHGSRADHPTLSSITDANDRFYLLKSLLFLAWMAGALVILRQGSRRRAARPAKRRK